MIFFLEKYYSVMKMLSLVSHLCHSILILSNHNEIPRISFFAGKNLPPFLEIFVQKIPIQNCF